MPILSKFKSTVLLLFLVFTSCKGQQKETFSTSEPTIEAPAPIKVAANRTEIYLPLLKEKKVGVVANPTSVIFKENDIREKGSQYISDRI